MGQKWTPAQKKAASERYKARAADKNKNPETQKDELSGAFPPEIEAAQAENRDVMSGPQPGANPVINEPSYDDLVRRMQEMEAMMWRTIGSQQQPQQPQGLNVGPNGSLVGVRDKYVLNPKRYPSPVKRLSDEQRLNRFAFKENYFLEFIVGVSQYQTKDGVNYREPKFTLELHRVLFDEDTGLPNGTAYTVCRMVFHEDPEAALAIANEQNIEVTEMEETLFLNEMRYLRMRDWLLECFYPRPAQASKKKKEMVIGNRVVEVFEINAESAQSIPFDQISQKKKL